jgi:hypothetical protein
LKFSNNIVRLGNNIEIFKWKDAVKDCFKLPAQWHFQIKNCNRILIKKGQQNVTVQGEMFLKQDFGVAKSIVKRGKSRNMRILLYKKGFMKNENIDDLKQLLVHSNKITILFRFSNSISPPVILYYWG